MEAEREDRDRKAETPVGSVRLARIEPSAPGGSPEVNITNMNRLGLTDSKHSLDVAWTIADPVSMTKHAHELYIERKNPAKNMARFYAMDITRTLFGQTCLSRRWGRIGARGQSKTHIFASEKDAVALFLDLQRQKASRGYRSVEGA